MNLEEILAVEQESFPTSWDRDTYQDMMADHRYTFLEEYVEGEFAGFAVMLDMVDIEEIIKIAVDKKFRKRGIASLLLNKIINIAKEKNKESLWLEVRVNNKPAINLYNKYRFEVVSIRKKYYSDTGEDAVVMKLDLR